jgi:DNA repair protein RadC
MLNCDLEVFKKNFKGLGDSFYCLLKLIKELQRRNIYEKVQPRFELNNLNDLVDYLRVFYNQQTTEIFKAIFLDSKSKILEDKILSYGTTNQAIVYPREIVKLALEKNAAYVIIVHNHPSGDPTPSREDFSVTLEIKSALKTVGISLFDSLIITYDSFYSFKKDGLI